MLIQARSYQSECVTSIYNYFQSNTGNPVCALPTGTGKSVVIAMFLESIYKHYPSQKILVLTHVKELIAQNYEKLMTVWPNAPAGINSAGLGKRDVHQKIIFAGIASVAKKGKDFDHVDLVIIDEAHLVSPTEETMYQNFINTLKETNPHLKIIGFTATPWRLGHGRITEDGIFTDICFDITTMSAFNRLIAEGYLAPLIPKQTRTVLRTDGVHMRGGEFIASELQAAVDRDEITSAALKEAMNLGSDRKHWLIFAAGVEHAENISNMLNSMGIDCHAIHSKITDAERDQRILDFKSGKVRAVVNNNVLTTGFDFPGIDLILVLRPTASTVLWVQMLGRGTRPLEGKENCLVLDFAGNTRRLGPINDPVIPRKKGEKGGEAPVKLCPSCSIWNHASVRHCVHCGAEFKMQVKLKNGASTQELIKGDMPVVEVFNIDHITYTEHNKPGKPPIMRVGYHCGYRMFEDFVCIEHDGFAGRKASQWWKERSEHPRPQTTEAALERISELKTPTNLRIWTNKQYPEILAYCYDGSAFGTLDEASITVAPTVQGYSKKPVEKKEDDDPFSDMGGKVVDDFDDDIPF